mmetsp:Transcript_92178/g.219559  ORF Transcript_92178/g.219559 Transcript_92178/m.219559 type:complete len:216 (-) Transcript_92178:76-723(-)
MQNLEYRRTFIQIVDSAENETDGRAQSHPPRLSRHSVEQLLQEEEHAIYVDELATRAAQSFQWPSEPSPTSRGSLAHPEVCARPCIRFAYGNCSMGFLCGFCHMPHQRSKEKLDKAQRHCLDQLSEAEVFALILPHIEARCSKQGLLEKMTFVVAKIRRRSQALEVALPRRIRSALAILRRFSMGRLIEIVDAHPKVTQVVKDDLRLLLHRACAR